MLRTVCSVLLTAVIACSSGGASPAVRPAATDPVAPSPVADRTVDNLRAFARLYGYVKYFHPSDEAAAVDWNRFAVYGAGQVMDARDDAELADRLSALFGPIAPTVQIARGQLPPTAHDALAPASREGLSLVAWQHLGAGVDARAGSVYRSGRTNRERAVDGAPMACIQHDVDLDAVRGKRVRVRARLRSAGEKKYVDGRVLLGSYEPGADNSMAHHVPPVRAVGDTFADYELVRDLRDGVIMVWVGACLFHGGVLDVARVELAVSEAGAWKPVAVEDSELDRGGRGWDIEHRGYTTEARAEGKERFLRVAREPGHLPWALLPAHPEVGETVEVDLGGDVRARVPLALWSKDEHTRPPGEPAELVAALAGVATESPSGRFDSAVEAAAVIVAWNALQHFYPYFDVVDVDWPAQLDAALTRALAVDSVDAGIANIERLVGALRDGHGFVHRARKRGMLGVILEWVQEAPLVVASGEPAVAVGERVTAVEGVAIADWARRRRERTPGSRQWQNSRLPGALMVGPPGTTVTLELERADGTRHTVSLRREAADRAGAMRERPEFDQLEAGIQYVNLSRASWPDIRQRLDQLAAAPAVVFDLRGYPNSNHRILNHLLDRPDDHKWMFVPGHAYPDRRDVAWHRAGWSLQPAKPHIGGEVVFLTNGDAISYAESVMGFVHGYQLGTIVGSETAGANGDVNPISLPGGYTMMWTGLKVLRHDGEQLHTLGIPPDVRVEPTVAGFRAGRDEVLEAAVELLRKKLAK